MNSTAAVVLAAGKGTRMRSKIPKVLHKIGGKPLVWHVINAAKLAGVYKQILVVGYGAEEVKKKFIHDVDFAYQSEQLGTGHAVKQAKDIVPEDVENILVLCGDTPLLRSQTIQKLLKNHGENKALCTILSANAPNPEGYGRIVRDNRGNVQQIIEEKDADEEVKMITEINTGAYCFNKEKLFEALEELTPKNKQGEYYLTDVISIFREKGLQVISYVSDCFEEIKGVNDRSQLAAAEKILRTRKNNALMQEGITLIDPDTTYVDEEAVIGPDTVIHPFSFVKGDSTIGAGCEIGPHTSLEDVSIGENTKIVRSVVVESSIGSRCEIGPFSYIRPGTVLHQRVKIGTYVEVKKSTIDDESKISHLSYIGDAELGKNVNVGAGTITCNFDGERKWKTVIEDDAFIGSNTNLIAPINIGAGSYIGAGSTITEDVPADSLGLARIRQKNIIGWVKKKKK